MSNILRNRFRYNGRIYNPVSNNGRRGSGNLGSLILC